MVWYTYLATLRNVYQYVGSLTRPVRYRSKTVLHMPL